jgi:AraC-like DNA-binding protein
MMLMNATGGIGWRESSVLFDMLISPAEWGARGARPEDGLMQRLWGKSEAMQLLRGYVRSLERIGFAASVDNQALILVDLAVLATTARCPIGESSASEVVATRRTAALDYIASHFSDPELSLAKVARSLRISPRYLQRLLATAGISFASHVIELRLKQAYMLLTAQRGGKVRISDIALQSGFSDVSYFNRLFRSRFGDTPSGVRGASPANVANIFAYQV